ncbi:VanZ family protein [Paradevosia shaoguanensis]|uniref:VanZ family protein n=2 Tax=Paradevosia shaoguanensis TaxID=1335043 RepID=UPI000455C6D2|nr:FIG00451263: hypothetical protein [Devosia sp. DBB001]
MQSSRTFHAHPEPSRRPRFWLDRQMIRMAARPLAWLLLLGILLVTVLPIEWRPVTGEPANLERLVAFALVGFVFVVGYPRHWWLVLGLVIAVALGFELAQLLAPSRHATLKDAVVKVAGGSLGVTAGVAANFLFTRLVPR